MAESYLGEDNAKALEYINIIRKERNDIEITYSVDDNQLQDLIVNEYRKDVIGEGQIFYMYKRLNLSSIQHYYGYSIDMDDTKYTFPLPDDEVQFGGR